MDMHHESALGPRPKRASGDEAQILGKKIEPFWPFLDALSLVTEEEIETFSQANKARLQGDKATVREQSCAQLQNQKLATPRQAFLQALRSQATVVMHLKAPSVFRAQVATNGILAKEKSGSMGSGLAWPHASALRG